MTEQERDFLRALRDDLDSETAPQPGDEARLQSAIDAAMGSAAPVPSWHPLVKLGAIVGVGVALAGGGALLAARGPSTPSTPLAVAPDQHEPVAASAPLPTSQPPTSSTIPTLVLTPTTPASNAVTPAPATEVLSARELFRRANEARRDERTNDAVSLYAELVRRYPTSSEAATSEVALGRLYLDKGSFDLALGQYDAYLADPANSALREEALYGKANALDKLGRTDDATAAWRSMLTEFPSSVYATRAKQRLDASP